MNSVHVLDEAIGSSERLIADTPALFLICRPELPIFAHLTVHLYTESVPFGSELSKLRDLPPAGNTRTTARYHELDSSDPRESDEDYFLI